MRNMGMAFLAYSKKENGVDFCVNNKYWNLDKILTQRKFAHTRNGNDRKSWEKERAKKSVKEKGGKMAFIYVDLAWQKNKQRKEAFLFRLETFVCRTHHDCHKHTSFSTQ